MDFVNLSHRPPRPILYRLRHVRRLNLLHPRQIRNRPGQLHAWRPVIGPRTMHLLHGRLDQAGAGLIQGIVQTNLRRPHIRIRLQLGPLEPLPLDGPRPFDPLPYLRAGFAGRRDWLLSFSNTQRVQVARAALRRAKRVDP